MESGWGGKCNISSRKTIANFKKKKTQKTQKQNANNRFYLFSVAKQQIFFDDNKSNEKKIELKPTSS